MGACAVGFFPLPWLGIREKWGDQSIAFPHAFFSLNRRNDCHLHSCRAVLSALCLLRPKRAVARRGIRSRLMMAIGNKQLRGTENGLYPEKPEALDNARFLFWRGLASLLRRRPWPI